ncbi:hypothetical protein ACQCT5_04675 [Sutcliffiella halmapala]
MYKIKTPNGHYNGTTHGVQFVNGLGETKDENVKNTLLNDFGYELVKEQIKKEEKPKEVQKANPSTKK